MQTQNWTNLLITFGILVGLLLLLAVVVAVMRRWYADDSKIVDADELVADFRAMVDAGELTDEEFRKIRASLGTGRGPHAPPAKPKATTPEEPSADDAHD